MSKWISVNDEMPHNYTDVLVYFNRKTAAGRRIAVGHWSPGFTSSIDGTIYPPEWMPKQARAAEVSHWMPLPKGPK